MTDKLEVLVAINAVKAALAKEGISKDQTNTHQKYKFRGIDDIYNALSSLMATNNLSLMPKKVERWASSGEKTIHVTVKVIYEFISSVDGSSYQIEMWGEALDFSDKATNKAMSAAYKYACIQAFCIPTEGDEDADSQHIPASPSKKQSEPSLCSQFKANVLKSFNACTTKTALDDLAALNKDKLSKMREGNEEEREAVQEISEAYHAKDVSFRKKTVDDYAGA